MIAHLFTWVVLSFGAMSTNAHRLPDVAPGLIDPAIAAAVEFATDEVPASLLLSIAWSESRLDPTVRTGHVCGALQVNPEDLGWPRDVCDLWSHSVRASFAAGAAEMHALLADHRVHHDLRLALLYRACGNSAFNGTCSKTRWPAWVLARAAWLLHVASRRKSAV